MAEKTEKVMAKRRQSERGDALEQAIEAALDPGRFVSFNAAWSFVNEVQGARGVSSFFLV